MYAEHQSWPELFLAARAVCVSSSTSFRADCNGRFAIVVMQQQVV